MATIDETIAKAKLPAPPSVGDRRQAIGAAAPQSRMLVAIGEDYIEIPVISIAQEDLIYRSANGRIVTELQEHLTKAGGSIAALRADEASLGAQTLLHGLLVAKAAEPAGPVMAELARHARQTEALLATAEGVLVNGNRRLAAMRELLARDPARYAGFENVMVGVLPDEIGEREIEFIEASLQMAPDVKLAYGWINRRLKLRHQRDVLELSAEAIADAYRMEDADQVQIELDQLGLAERYLISLKGRLDYSLIGDMAALFIALRTQLAALPTGLRPVWETLGFAMIDGRADGDATMDRFFPFAPPAPPALPTWTLRRLAEEAGFVPLIDEQRATARSPELPAEPIDQLRQRFADPERTRENATSLAGMMEQLRAEYADERAPINAIKLVGRARTALATLEVGRMTAKQRRQLRSEMVALEASVASLLGEDVAIPTTQPGLLDRLFGAR